MKISNLMTAANSITLVLAFSLAQAPLSAALAETGSKVQKIVRDVQDRERVHYPFWSGEYPGPVVDVFAKKPGETTVQVQTSYSKLGARMSCTIKNGLYHPWSETENSVNGYFTVTAHKEYELLKDFSFESPRYDEKTGDVKIDVVTAAKSDRLTKVIDLAEGYCGAELIQDAGRVQKAIDFSCDLTEDAPTFQKTSSHQNDNGFL